MKTSTSITQTQRFLNQKLKKEKKRIYYVGIGIFNTINEISY